MPSADRSDSPDDREKDDSRGGKKSASSKTAKDLSHVPCKFYKVGSCTAGSSCPFSHSLVEPGGQKDVCAWFVKGNCKFGHKCALAHVLPGQTMAMDRKNKKAAQIAAGGAKNHEGGGKGRGGSKRDGGNNARNPLLAGGSTAPTRARPPMNMPLKATISPSAPAPPLKDTDFASFAALDESSQLPTAPARNKSPSPTQTKPPSPTLPVSAPRRPSMTSTSPNKDFGPIGSPPSSATSPARMHSGTPPTQANGFLSTSPFSAPGQSMFRGYADTGRTGMAASLGSGMAMGGGPGGWNSGGVNGTSSSPLRTSLLSASAGRQNGGYDVAAEYELEFGSTNTGRRKATLREDSTEDLEDFLPSSLTDLLTPEERMRRMSRTNSGQGAGEGTSPSPARHGLGVPLNQHAGGGHRYSRSVPAPSLLGGEHGQLKSIWAAEQGPPPGLGLPSSPMHNSNLGPSSYSSARSGGFGGRDNNGGGGVGSGSFVDDHLGGMGMRVPSLSPSNASAAFLPGIHHYINQNKRTNGLNASGGNAGNFASNAAAAQGPPGIAHYLHAGPSGVQHAMNSNNSSPSPNANAAGNANANAPNAGAAHPNNANANNNNAYVRPNPFDLTQQLHHGQTHILSPSARALQAHAPGQSLPQGLAAGYSRIHALPPPAPMIGSPSPAAFGTSPSFGVGAGGVNSNTPGLGVYVTGGAGTGGSRDWATMSPGSISGSPGFPPSFMSSTKPAPPPAPSNANATQGQGQGGKAMSPPGAGAAGLETMFSRLSYSAAAGARGAPPPGIGGAPGMQRNPSGGGGATGGAGGAGRWTSGTPRSPLSPPVAARDVEDDLFPLDE
ncbi:hypothetical protein B0H16DRAFT_1676714 [Mycena metata]|uniref:C3H1-type domain-containing protein n=1 Tax=Mycena metata TaxID=1033252 RepID=A0AAD7I5Q1_9AGAR|nr:hypothetical protein B0H16DRAFT_1676714 [Mycena metata]